MLAHSDPAPVSISAAIPSDEEERLSALYRYEILDSDPEPEFDALARLAAKLCSASVGHINFIDRTRLWTKAAYQMESGGDTPRESAFCPHTIVSPDGFMVIEDALDDPRFARNPFVLGEPNIRFYAGAAIRARSGHALGSVCVIGTEPRTLTADERTALLELSTLATTQLELRRLLTAERRLVVDLRDLDRQKADFTSSVAHDFRTPLTAIRGYAELLRDEAIAPDIALDAIDRGSERLLDLVDDLTGTTTELRQELVDLSLLTQAAVELIRPAASAGGVTLEVDLEEATVRGDRHRLAQVIENLVGNAVKYSPNGSVEVRIRADDRVTLEVTDTGVGIPRAEIPQLFDRFFRASTADTFAGTGVGLATVKAIVDAHDGSLEVVSAVGRGSTFVVSFPKP